MKLPSKVLLFFTFFFTLGFLSTLSPKSVQASAGYLVTPIVFYANDSDYPSDQYLQGIDRAMASVKYFYQLQLGETFEYTPTRRFLGLSSKNYYSDTDDYACGSIRVMCNISHEMIFHEKNALKFYGASDTGFGWTDRLPLIFTHDIVRDTLGGADWGRTVGAKDPTARWAVITDGFSDTIGTDPGTCSANFQSVLSYYNGGGYFGNTACGAVAHELGHGFGLGHYCVNGELMSPDLDIKSANYCPSVTAGVDKYAANTFIYDKITASNSLFTNSPQIGTYTPTFCFASDDKNSWCTSFAAGLNLSSYPNEELTVFGTNTTKPDCCRVNFSPRITLGGFNLEWCIAGVARGSPTYCQKKTGLVATYSQTLALAPLDGNGNPLYYDIYVDYQTISSGKVPWKVLKSVNQLCFAATCNYTLSWNKPYFSAKLYQTQTTNGACTGYANCTDFVASVAEDNPFPKFTSLPPDLSVDMVVQIKPMENSGTAVTHWSASGLLTPTCPNKPIVPAAPTLGSSSLSGVGGSQSVTLTWTPPVSWGLECNYTNPREYLVAFGQTDPPPFYLRTTATSITIPTLNPGGTFFWRIAAQNKANLWGAYSSQGSFLTSPPIATNTFVGQYFDNLDFTNRKLVRTDPKIGFYWSSSSPDPSLGADTFSIKWSGTFSFDTARYRFNSAADDKVLIYLDNNLVLDGSAGKGVYNKLVNMTAGVHSVRIDYVENTANASISSNWVHANTCFDLNGDGKIDSSDQAVETKHYGEQGLNLPWDFNNDGVVNSTDQLIQTKQFGLTCS